MNDTELEGGCVSLFPLDLVYSRPGNAIIEGEYGLTRGPIRANYRFCLLYVWCLEMLLRIGFVIITGVKAGS